MGLWTISLWKSEDVDGSHLPICNKTITRRDIPNKCLRQQKKFEGSESFRRIECLINILSFKKNFMTLFKRIKMKFYDLIRNRTKKGFGSFPCWAEVLPVVSLSVTDLKWQSFHWFRLHRRFDERIVSLGCSIELFLMQIFRAWWIIINSWLSLSEVIKHNIVWQTLIWLTRVASFVRNASWNY